MNIEYPSDLSDPSSFLGRKGRDLIDGRSLTHSTQDIREKDLAFEPELFSLLSFSTLIAMVFIEHPLATPGLINNM